MKSLKKLQILGNLVDASVLFPLLQQFDTIEEMHVYKMSSNNSHCHFAKFAIKSRNKIIYEYTILLNVLRSLTLVMDDLESTMIARCIFYLRSSRVLDSVVSLKFLRNVEKKETKAGEMYCFCSLFPWISKKKVFSFDIICKNIFVASYFISSMSKIVTKVKTGNKFEIYFINHYSWLRFKYKKFCFTASNKWVVSGSTCVKDSDELLYIQFP
eukprot:snap_masked-scaffold_30-processed-gene-1.32-mRNA-1 protein AED:1.00 eAED:1.00 QI:0/0/0/0/1/1/2/0/212